MKIDYNEFLFYNLTQTQTKHPLYQIEYDIAWQDLPYYYDKFCSSTYNNEDISEYDAIINYLTDYKPYPFKEGEDYYTIEDTLVVWSCWDNESELMHDTDPNKKYFRTKEAIAIHIQQLIKQLSNNDYYFVSS